MPTTETATLDPAVFSPGRVPLALDQLGIHIVEADWGESDVELFLVKQARGEIPGDRHPPNQTITLKLRVRDHPPEGMSLAEVAFALQSKVGTIQDESGFIERKLDSGGKYKFAVAYQVFKAALSGLDGWQMAHRGVAHEVMLTLERGPYCYGVTEQKPTKFTAENARELIWELEGMLGTAPGIIRLITKNEDATDWNGILSAIECRDHMEGSNSELVQQAQLLTHTGGTLVEKAGSASSKVVQRGLNSKWRSILESPLAAGETDLQHKGFRSLWLRAYNESAVPGATRFKVQWKMAGAPRWSEEEEIRCEVVNGWALLNLATCRLLQMPLGQQKWQFRILARTEGASVVYLDRTLTLPTEQMLQTQIEVGVEFPATYLAEDSMEHEGSLNGFKDELGNEWETLGSAEDFNGKLGQSFIRRTHQDLVGEESEGKVGRKAFVKGISKKNFVAQLEFERPLIGSGEYCFQGIQTGQETPYVCAVDTFYVGSVQTWIRLGTTEFAIPTIPANTPLVLTLLVIGSNAFGWLTTPGATFGAPTVVANVNEGFNKLGFIDHANGVGRERRYLKFTAWEPEVASLVYANRLAELRSDGFWRQHKTKGEAYGLVTPDGFLPYSPPARLENRKVKGLLLPTSGNFKNLKDEGNHKLSLEVKYFPGYHFASEST